MKKLNLTTLSFIAILNLTSVTANAKMVYDNTTGNHYNIQNFGHTARIDGGNTRTGKNWTTTIDKHGNMRGIDAGMNSWNFNNSTGYYYNSNGTHCMGKRRFRTCN